MSKQRVHELAKEFGKTNKDVMDFLKSKNIDVKSHMSTWKIKMQKWYGQILERGM